MADRFFHGPDARGHGGQCPFYAGRAGRASFTGAGCEDHSRDPTGAARCENFRRGQGRSHARCVQRQVVDSPVVTKWLSPMVQVMQTTVIPQLQSVDKVVDVRGFADRAGSSCASVVETLVLPPLQISWTTVVIPEGVGMPVGVPTSGCSSTG